MKYFIFDFESNKSLIDSFLSSCALAHNQELKDAEWFNWKFKENPFGQSILACAEDEGRIIGCVAYGKQQYVLNNIIYNGVISFETFVHPNYQGQGIFSNLIKLGESEALNLGIDFMLNFPNKNSITGFLRDGWHQLIAPEYWIKSKNPLNLLMNFKNLKKKVYS